METNNTPQETPAIEYVQITKHELNALVNQNLEYKKDMSTVISIGCGLTANVIGLVLDSNGEFSMMALMKNGMQAVNNIKTFFAPESEQLSEFNRLKEKYHNEITESYAAYKKA